MHVIAFHTSDQFLSRSISPRVLNPVTSDKVEMTEGAVFLPHYIHIS